MKRTKTASSKLKLQGKIIEVENVTSLMINVKTASYHGKTGIQ